MNNYPIVYIEIPAPNYAETKNFYSEVFNWKITDSQLDNKPYAMFSTEGGEYGLTGGGLNPELQPLSKDSVVIYIGVEDILSTMDRMASNGGQRIKEKTRISEDHGFYSVFKDPSGNHIALWAKH